MPYITTENEFLSFREKVNPLANLLFQRERVEVYYAEPYLITSKPSFAFFRSLAIKGGDEYYYFYDRSIEHTAHRLSNYIRKTAQYPLIRIPNSLDIDTACDEINTSFPDHFEGHDRFVFNAMESGDYIIAPPSLKWYLYADREVEIAKLSTYIGLPEEPKEPHDGFLDKTAAERIIMTHMKWKYSM